MGALLSWFVGFWEGWGFLLWFCSVSKLECESGVLLVRFLKVFKVELLPSFLRVFFSSALWGSKSRGEFLGTVTSNSTLFFFFSQLVSIGFFL